MQNFFILRFSPNLCCPQIQNGVKVYCLCDSPRDDDKADEKVKGGYLYSFNIFTGSAPIYDSAGNYSTFDNDVVAVVDGLLEGCGFEEGAAWRARSRAPKLEKSVRGGDDGDEVNVDVFL